MNVAYVEMVEDLTTAMVSTSKVREIVDGVLGDLEPARVPRDREAWLRGQDAAQGQAVMLDFARGRGR